MMLEDIRINGYDFEFVSQDNGDDEFYQCRGEVCYDDEHDETPDPDLWDATLQLEKLLEQKGYKAVAGYSEKGWQEVQILNK